MSRAERRTEAIHEFHTLRTRWAPSNPALGLSFVDYWRTKNDPLHKREYEADQRRAAARRQADAAR